MDKYKIASVHVGYKHTWFEFKNTLNLSNRYWYKEHCILLINCKTQKKMENCITEVYPFTCH